MRRDEWAGRRRADPVGDRAPGARSTFSGGWGRFVRGREVPRRSSRWRLRFNPLSFELISVLVDPKVVDAILRHLELTDQPTSVHARDPPAA